MRRAAAEDDDDAAEIDDLAKDAEVPIEELMRRYREMEAAHDAATAAEADRAASEGFPDEEEDDEAGDGDDDEDDEDDEDE